VTGVERLWSGWRSAYVAGEAVDTRASFDAGAGAASVFSQLLRSGLPDEETHIVHRGQLCFAIMNAFPYTNGHLMVLPYREVSDLVDLDDAETTELWGTVTAAVTAVRRAFHPDGVNVGMNLGRASGGSVPTHLHVHVVNTQTIPESLPVSARKVREAWQAADLPS
jgi:ATP adenylyltransferase